MSRWRLGQWLAFSLLFVVAGGLSTQEEKSETTRPNGSLHMAGLQLAVKDLESSKAFYHDTLGLALTAEEPGHRAEFQWVLLRLGP